jgi:hypothetical protein
MSSSTCISNDMPEAQHAQHIQETTSEENTAQYNASINADGLEQEEAQEEEKPELDPAQKLARLEEAVRKQSLHREILYKTLGFCVEQKGLREVEEYMGSLPDFKQAVQSQYHLISVLVKAGGLDKYFLDVNDEIIDEAAFDGLDEDEIDDLICGEAYKTTEIGKEFFEQKNPISRIKELFIEEPTRKESYIELLKMCHEKHRTYSEIATFLKDKGVLFREVNGERQAIQASVFVDRLQRAGALIWDGSWNLTKEGEDFLGKLTEE